MEVFQLDFFFLYFLTSRNKQASSESVIDLPKKNIFCSSLKKMKNLFISAIICIVYLQAASPESAEWIKTFIFKKYIYHLTSDHVLQNYSGRSSYDRFEVNFKAVLCP